MSNKPTLSVVIVSYNTKSLLEDCLKSLEKVKSEAKFEIIVTDNGSTDGSVDLIKNNFPEVILIVNKENLGFAAGNNKANKYAHGEFVLFLNSDTIVNPRTIKETISYLQSNSEVGAVTCKVILKDGQLDRDTRRSFPTPWVALTHFSHLDRLFPKSKLFSKYWYGYLSPHEEHEIDVLQGAYCLTRRSLLDKINWFNEAYFLDGEDIDLCWRIKKAGYKIIYYPRVSIIHVKGASKGKRQKEYGKQDIQNRKKTVLAGLRAMEIFYKENMWSSYPFYINYLVISGINFLKLIRTTRLYLKG